MLRIENLDLVHRDSAGGQHRALRDVSLTCPQQQIVAVLGPSGAGKSSLLSAIAGLQRPSSGSIRFGDEYWFGGPDSVEREPAARRIGMMVQSYALWPHMSVREHLAFPLEHGFGKVAAVERAALIDDMVAVLGLEGMETRCPAELSGGQQQRLALGRAMINRPRLILLDEPFSNLDPNKRRAVARDVRRLQRHFGMTVMIATHDHAEAGLIADSVAVLMDGILVQQGTPDALFHRPETRAVGEFMGELNVLPISAISNEQVRTPYFSLPRTVLQTPEALQSNPKWLAFRPGAVRLVTSDDELALRGRILEISSTGEMVHTLVAVGEARIIVKTIDRPPSGEGSDCRVAFPHGSAFLLSR